MSIDGHYRFDRIWPSHWEAEARKSGYDGEQALAHVRDILDRLPDEARTLLAICRQEGSATGELDQLFELMVGRCTELARTFGAKPMAAEQKRLPGL